MPGQEVDVDNVGRGGMEAELIRRLEGIRDLSKQELTDRLGQFLTQSVELQGRELTDASRGALYRYSSLLADKLKESEFGGAGAPDAAARLITMIKMWWGVPQKVDIFEALYKRLYGTTTTVTVWTGPQGEDFAQQLFLPFAAELGGPPPVLQLGPPPDGFAYSANYANSTNNDNYDYDYDLDDYDLDYGSAASNSNKSLSPLALGAAGLAGVALLFLLSRR